MSGSPRILSECITAFDSMSTQESPNDYMVGGLDPSSLEVKLVESGMGGMARVREILGEQFETGTAVAVFRLTGVDDRENTVSYRTKLVHVIFTGPRTPVMKRAKVGSYHSVLKEKFSCNLYIQTDDLEDLAEDQIERRLRLSGGAHQPNRYDFTNECVSGGVPASSAKGSYQAAASQAYVKKETPVEKPQEVSKPVAAPVVSAALPPKVSYPSTQEVCQTLYDAIQAEDVDTVMTCFTEESEVVHMDGTERATRSYTGMEEIKSFYTWWFERLGGCKAGLTVPPTTTGPIHKREETAEEAGFAYLSSTVFVKDGNVLLVTLVTVDVMEEVEEDEQGGGEMMAAAGLIAAGTVMAEGEVEVEEVEYVEEDEE